MSKFASLALAVDMTARMIVVHPITNRPLRTKDGVDAYIDLHGSDSQKGQDLDRKITTQRLARRNRNSLTADELEAEQIDRAATLITGWQLVGLDGVALDVPFNETNARELCAEPSMLWLREQIIAYQANRANFTKASSTT